MIAVIVQILRFTIVTVSDEKVCVKRLLKKYTLELEKYYFYEKIEYKKLVFQCLCLQNIKGLLY